MSKNLYYVRLHDSDMDFGYKSAGTFSKDALQKEHYAYEPCISHGSWKEYIAPNRLVVNTRHIYNVMRVYT